jgi:hypothetical protein
MRRALVGLLLVFAACGQAQGGASASPGSTATAETSPSSGGTPSPTAQQSPTSSGPLLFAVLEAKIPGSPYTWNTAAVAGLDGYARAKATFIPMPSPDLGCMGSVLPPSAHVAAGRVYFADGKGVVRSLSTRGQVTTVATFPLTSSQQTLSFAVSPDGSRLLGAVLTASAKYFSCSASQPAHSLSLDVFSAQAGGASALLYHQSLSDASKVMALTGWDAVGPLGTYPTVWASQGGGPGSTLGVAARIDANTGKVVRQVADPSVCQVWDMAFSGDYLCLGNPVANSAGAYDTTRAYDTTLSLHSVNGAEITHFSVTTPDGSACCPFVAPDEQHMVVGAYYVSVVGARNGTRFNLGSNVPGKQFGAAGWLDSETVIGAVSSLSPSPNLAYVRLTTPGATVSLGFPGNFVGTVNR